MSATAARSPALVEVARSERHLWNGVFRTPEGRLFASMPAWLGLPTPGVVEIREDGSLTPFPGNHWNEWREGADASSCFVDVNSVIADGKGSLWVVDAAAPRLGPAIEGAVKIVELEIATGATKRVIRFDGRTPHAGTRLAHMRFHGDHAFLVESREASIFVIDLRDGSYRRVLVGHPLLRCAEADIPVVEGREMRLHGRPMYFHSDLIEFGADPDAVLFMCLFGRRIFRVDAGVLKDPELTDADIARHVTVAYRLENASVSAIARDRSGRIYLGDAEHGGINRLNADGSVTPIVRDRRLKWPIGPSVGPDGFLYFADSQVNRIPVFTGGPDDVERPWRLYRLALDG